MSKLYKILGIEVARTGTFRPKRGPERVTITHADLDRFAEVNNWMAGDLGVRIPLKIAHDSEQRFAGTPNVGLLHNWRREDNRLLADAADVPEIVARAVKERRYAYRSPEISAPFEYGGRQIDSTVIGLALLGEELPAIDGLNDISALVCDQSPIPAELAAAADGFEMAMMFSADLDREVGIEEIEAIAEMAGMPPQLAQAQHDPNAQPVPPAPPVEGASSAETLLAWIAGRVGVAPGDHRALLLKIASGTFPTAAPPKDAGEAAAGLAADMEVEMPESGENAPDRPTEAAEATQETAEPVVVPQEAEALAAAAAQLASDVQTAQIAAMVDAEVRNGVPPAARATLIWLASQNARAYEVMVKQLRARKPAVELGSSFSGEGGERAVQLSSSQAMVAQALSIKPERMAQALKEN